MLTIAFLDIYSFLPSPFAYLYVSSHEQDMEEQKKNILLKALEKPLPTPIVKKHAFLCVSNKLLYFCKRKELLDKQTYVYCRNRNRC